MVKTKNANVGREGHGEEGGSSRGGNKGKGKQVARSETPLDKFISVQAVANYEDWTKKKRKIALEHRVDLSDMGGMEIIPALFQDISWGSLLIVYELFCPMMLYEFYANLPRCRTQTGGNIVTSRVNGKNIAFNDRLLNSILETPEDGMHFYTKNKKCFDPNLYSEKRFEELFTRGIVFQHFKITFFGPNDHIGIGKIYNKNTFKRMGFSSNEDVKLIRGGQEKDSENSKKGEEEKGNEPEEKRTEEGSFSGSMNQVMEMIASLQTSINTRLDALDDKISNIQERVMRLEARGRDEGH
ncbi:hypothetical protein M9H77_07913 [Catharanthus roseus]|uniref:Uncharacterized protein n=1 Tax=Catharanthus roseus TaxID=4058 RepID=A0ACC0BWQ0_CATRO|nr:hypothetical protein M9H77_07913 [Catharanthus roseus]